jgi:hypothetical protein
MLPEARLRSKAAVASESANVESIATRSSLLSTRRASSTSCSRLGSTTKYIPAPGGSPGDRDETAAAREQAGRALEELAADRVEDEIDRADPVVELPPAVDHLMSAECACCLERPRRRGCDHVGAAPARQLGRELADTTDRSVNEHRLAVLEPPCANRPCQALSAGSGTAALSTWLGVDGFGASVAAGDGGVLGRDTVAVERRQRVHLGADGDRIWISW